MSFKKRIPLILFASAFSVWSISLLAVYLPVSPWGANTFPKVVDASIMNVFLISTVLSFTGALVMGLRGFFNKPNLKASGENLLKTRTISTSIVKTSVNQPPRE